MDDTILDGWRQLIQANKVAFTSLTAGDTLQVAELIKATLSTPTPELEEETNDDSV
jgi:hypothetical protein